MPFGIQPIHIVIVVVIALIVFGPHRLPEIGRWAGRSITEFRKGTQEMTTTLREEMSKTDTPAHSAVQPVPAQPAETGGKFCTKCGASNMLDALFCNKCGNSLSA